MNPKQHTLPKLTPPFKPEPPEEPIQLSTTLLRSHETFTSSGDINISSSLPSSSFESFSTMMSPSPSLSLSPSSLLPSSSSADFQKLNNNLPRPLDCLQGNQVPAFLSKTFDLVEGPSLDPIISWGSAGVSFVVWDPTLFARHVLPRTFKHNNFSSFVRQLNTYGFRKIDTEKWEFFNEAFQRGKRHLLKNIQRRRPPRSQQVDSCIVPYADAGKAGIEFEVEKLRKERSELMQEMVDLQQQQRLTLQHARQVNERLQSAELMQKQTVSFLGKLFENPAFLIRLKHEKEQRDIGSPKVRRKFVKQHQDQTGISDCFKEGQIVRYQSDWRDNTDSSEIPEKHPVSFEESPNYLSPSLAKELSAGEENLISDELATMHEVMPLPTADTDTIGLMSSSGFGLEDTLFKGKNVMSSNQEVPEGEFVSFPEYLTKEAEFPEFSLLGTRNIIKQEDKWNKDCNVSGTPSNYGNEPWENPINCEVPEFEDTGGMSDMWDLSSL